MGKQRERDYWKQVLSWAGLTSHYGLADEALRHKLKQIEANRQPRSAGSFPGKDRSQLLRQLLAYGVIGGTQFVADATIYALLISFLGWPVFGNLASRGSAAVLGFWLNSRWTFRAVGDIKLKRRAVRYAAVWGLMTLLSTSLIAIFKHFVAMDGHSQIYIVFKIGLELGLSLFTFVLMKTWIFRSDQR